MGGHSAYRCRLIRPGSRPGSDVRSTSHFQASGGTRSMRRSSRPARTAARCGSDAAGHTAINQADRRRGLRTAQRDRPQHSAVRTGARAVGGCPGGEGAACRRGGRHGVSIRRREGHPRAPGGVPPPGFTRGRIREAAPPRHGDTPGHPRGGGRTPRSPGAGAHPPEDDGREGTPAGNPRGTHYREHNDTSTQQCRQAPHRPILVPPLLDVPEARTRHLICRQHCPHEVDSRLPKPVSPCRRLPGSTAPYLP